MALVKCKECGEKISKKAESCPKCGYNRKRKHYGCGTLILVVFIICGVFGLINSYNDSVGNSSIKTPVVSWTEEDNSTMAYIMMKDYVCSRLKSPKSSEFPGVFDGMLDHIVYVGDQKYTIKSYVDAQNSFGVSIRNNFKGEIEQISKDNWRLNSLIIY